MASKIAILSMSCNKDFFIREEKSVADTWAAPLIRGEVHDMCFYFFTAGDHDYIDEEAHKIYVKSEDAWNRTFMKTRRAMEVLLREHPDIDIIIRTNTSTYINIPLLDYLNRLNILDNGRVWGTDVYRSRMTKYLIGKFILMGRKHVQMILDAPQEYDTMDEADDYLYGKVFEDNEVAYKYICPYYIGWRPGFMYNHDRVDSLGIESALAISYKMFTGDEMNLKLRTDELQVPYKIHKRLQDVRPTLETVSAVMSYKQDIMWDHDIRKYVHIGSSACIVIPAYGDRVTKEWKVAFKSAVTTFSGKYDIFVVCKRTLDTKFFYDTAGVGNVSFIKVIDSMISTKEDFMQLCSTRELYEHFTKYEYVLIYEEPAIVDHDAMKQFMKMGYDYYGAPWDPAYLLSEFNVKGRGCGRGEVSLRKVEAMLRVTSRNKSARGIDDAAWLTIVNRTYLNICPAEVGSSFYGEKHVTDSGVSVTPMFMPQ